MARGSTLTERSPHSSRFSAGEAVQAPILIFDSTVHVGSEANAKLRRSSTNTRDFLKRAAGLGL